MFLILHKKKIMLIQETMTCSQCGAKFRGIVQFAQYRCDKCGTEYYFCPDCSHEQNLCKCGGMIITNDEYIRHHGITDIFGEHYDIDNRLIY